MGAVIQNGNIGAIIQNGIVYGGTIIESGSGQIDEIVRVTEDEWFNGTEQITPDGYTYDFITTDTGPNSAALQIIEYLNGTETQNVTWIFYLDPKPDIFHDVVIDYGVTANQQWTITCKTGKNIEIDGTEYSDTVVKQWSYYTTVNYTDCPGVIHERIPYIPDENKIYLITNNNGEMIKYQYQGSNRILRKQDISDYEFWYEDLVYPRIMNSSVQGNEGSCYWINTGIKLNSTENFGKSWQMEFNVHPVISNSYGGEKPIFGSNVNSGQKYEFYINSSNTNLYLYGPGFNDDDCGNVVDKNVIIKYESEVITVTVDGTTVLTKSYTPSVDNDNYLMIASYRDYYYFSGTMNYIGFKWLS